MLLDTSSAVACRVITPAEAIAIDDVLVCLGDGVYEIDLRRLSDAEREAWARLTDWHEHTRRCGK